MRASLQMKCLLECENLLHSLCVKLSRFHRPAIMRQSSTPCNILFWGLCDQQDSFRRDSMYRRVVGACLFVLTLCVLTWMSNGDRG